MVASSSSMLHELLGELFELQKRTLDHPYSIIHRLNLAKTYQKLGYPDLATGDAYKALLLVDEVTEEGEYHAEASEAAIADMKTCMSTSKPQHSDLCCQPTLVDENASDEDKAVSWAKKCWSKSAYDILISSLIDCGSLRSASDYNARALRAFPETDTFVTYQRALQRKVRSHVESKGEKIGMADIQDYPDKGLVRRELYPWNEYEPDRFSPHVLQFLNDELAQIAPKLEVRAVELPLLSEPFSSSTKMRYVKQLGVFAKEDIPPGELILQEKSLLTAILRLHDSYCDACSIPLPNTRDTTVQTGSETTILACDECDEVFFCSQECHDLARDSYHPSLCGVDIEQKVSAGEAADSLYTLLLIRAIALAETQSVHPLELKELRYIWGDYHGLDLDTMWKKDSDAFASLPRTLPFSFDANVLRPLHILEKMEVNIFEQSYRYDTWIFNTLYAKFRGTASAQQGLDGRPEIGAVHPMWCLANHSCDPNVAWEWQGSMCFWTREQLVDWKGRGSDKKPGLRKGEEILSHYCDIRLLVKERREWAVGALGGLCMCPRCTWEDAEENRPNTASK